MKEMTGDLFAQRGPKSVLVIPTNGQVKYGTQTAVMGAGVAKQAAQVWPELPKLLGQKLIALGNQVFVFRVNGNERVITFPTKEHWSRPSRLDLIEKSAQELANLATVLPREVAISLPRVGCGLGTLDWKDVKPILEKYLDDRFVVVHQKEIEKESNE